jgi:hypothetical protein
MREYWPKMVTFWAIFFTLTPPVALILQSFFDAFKMAPAHSVLKVGTAVAAAKSEWLGILIRSSTS